MSADFLAGQEAFPAPSRRMARERGRAGKRPLRRRSTVVNTGSRICKTAPPPWKPRLSAFHAPFREASLSEPGKAGLSWGPAAPCRANRRRPPDQEKEKPPLDGTGAGSRAARACSVKGETCGGFPKIRRASASPFFRRNPLLRAQPIFCTRRSTSLGLTSSSVTTFARWPTRA